MNDLLLSIKQVKQSSPTSPGTGEAPSSNWNIVQLILFRLTFTYLMLYSLESLIELTQLKFLWQFYRDVWQPIISFVAQHVIKISPIDSYQMYSGDSVYNYIEILCLAAISLVVTLVWSILDRKRQNYNRLHTWFRFCMRMHLGASMIGYGWVKVVQTQFPPLDLIRLTRPLGDYSPAGLLWATIGYSFPYGAFGGLAEVIGGMLLILPSCVLAGSVLCFAAALNVFMFNMCYDIGVKIFSFHLLLTAVVLLLPEWKGLWNYFFLNRNCSPVSYVPLFSTAKFNRLAAIFQIFFCFYYLGHTAYTDAEYKSKRRQAGDYVQRGVWIVEEQTIDGIPVSYGNEPELHWGRLIFDRGSALVVQDYTGNRTSYEVSLEKNKVLISRDEKKVGELQFALTHPNHATIDGVFESKRVHCSLKALPEKDITLTGPGFHWMDEDRQASKSSEKHRHNN